MKNIAWRWYVSTVDGSRPAASIAWELLTEQPVDEGCHVHPEIRARRDDVAVDARLDLALEESLVLPRRIPPGPIAPSDMLADETDGPASLLTLGIEPQPSEELQHVECVGPILRERVAGPQAVRRLEGQ